MINNEQFGISNKSVKIIRDVLKNFPEVEQSLIFGSRAKGNHKKGSDIDLALLGEKVTAMTAFNISAILNERQPLPYYFDVVSYTHLDNTAFLSHINNIGKIFYKRSDQK